MNNSGEKPCGRRWPQQYFVWAYSLYDYVVDLGLRRVLAKAATVVSQSMSAHQMPTLRFKAPPIEERHPQRLRENSFSRYCGKAYPIALSISMVRRTAGRAIIRS
jgi:hypothetical protein